MRAIGVRIFYDMNASQLMEPVALPPGSGMTLAKVTVWVSTWQGMTRFAVAQTPGWGSPR